MDNEINIIGKLKNIAIALLIHSTVPFLLIQPSISKSCSNTTIKDSIVENYYENNLFRYDDYVYKKNIKTVQLFEESFELSSPIIQLNTAQKIKLSFDDLNADYKRYSYTIIHCSANWEPSDMSALDYSEGYTENYISDYKFSFSTLQRYTHYNLTFPNDNIKLTKSGNYILKVCEDGDDNNVVLSKRFMVFDDKISIDASIKPATIINDRYYKQELDFTINHPNYEITNPFEDIKVVVTQNGRWDNTIAKLKPLFVKEDQLVYDYDEDNVFNGGNEFRTFDIRSFRYGPEKIKRIERDSLKTKIYLTNDDKKSFLRYSSENDINGKYLIKFQEGNDSEREGDYAFINFFLPFETITSDGDLYVYGALTDWQCNSSNKMKYNPTRLGYEVTLYLKQGYYNYQYVLKKDLHSIPDETYVEGNHYETENDYSIYVYHRAMGTRCDQLIGIKKLNSVKR